jgi:hypothetical protein
MKISAFEKLWSAAVLGSSRMSDFRCVRDRHYRN